MKKILVTLLAVLLMTLCMPFTMITAYAEPIRTMDEFDIALNTTDGEIDFENDADYPWLLCADEDGNESGAVMSNIVDIDDSITAFSFAAEMEMGGRLRFDYSTSTESGYDFFNVYDNDSIIFSRSGENEWSTATITVVEAGVHNFRFEYAKDGSTYEGNDTVYVDNVQVLPMDPNAPTLNDVMNAVGNELTYVAENNSWVVSNYLDRDCAKSSIEGQDEAVAVLYTESYIEADYTLTFDYATASEEDFDMLYFSVENLDTGYVYENVLEASGEYEWATFGWCAPESGNYRLYWKYEKDSSTGDYMDAVFVANCNVPRPVVGETVWSTSFEDQNPLDCGWTTIDADGDGSTWQWTGDYENFLYGHSVSADGRMNMSSASYSEYTWSPLTPDNYLVSPAITIGEDNTAATFKFSVRGQDDEAMAERFQILVGSSPDNLTDVLAEGVTSHTWTAYLTDLSDYIGETIYVAIRHFDTEDMYYLNFDMCEIIADGTVTVAETEPALPDNTELNEALNVEGGELSFLTGRLYPWSVVEDGDRTVAASANHVGMSAGYVELRLDIEEACRLSFDWRNSSEAGFDYIYLYVNGEIAANLREVNAYYTTTVLDLPEAGEYRIAWLFEKDDEISELDDIGYLDNVQILEAIHPESLETVDFLSVAKGEYAGINYTLLPEDTTNKNIIWTSMDESIATVDENGVVTAIGMGRTFVVATTEDGGIESITEVLVMAENDPQTFYGYRYIGSEGGRFDLVSFSDANPDQFNTITTISSPIISTMEYYNGTIYVIAGGGSVYTMTLEDPTLVEINGQYIADTNFADMAYNYANDTMYVLVSGVQASGLFTMDLTTGEFADVALITGTQSPAITLAIAADGSAYCMDNYYGNLYALDLETGAAEFIGATGYAAANNQSMTYDHSNDRLVWARYSYSNVSEDEDGLYAIDPASGYAKYLGDLGGTNLTQLVGLFSIPENEPGIYSVDFIDGITGEVVSSITIEKGEVIAELPEAPVHEGFVFVGWDYDNSPIQSNTRIIARYATEGDANMNGSLDVDDALLIVRAAIGVAEQDEMLALLCDMDSDGVITLADAILVFRSALID